MQARHRQEMQAHHRPFGGRCSAVLTITYDPSRDRASRRHPRRGTGHADAFRDAQTAASAVRTADDRVARRGGARCGRVVGGGLVFGRDGSSEGSRGSAPLKRLAMKRRNRASSESSRSPLGVAATCDAGGRVAW